MPYCPKCRKDYQKGIKTCSACGSKLVELTDNAAEGIDDKEAFLINASDEMEASIFISKLSALGIPVMKKYVELGLPVFMGNSRLGIDLYVPSRLLAEAKNILNVETISDDEINFDDMLNEYGFDDIDNLDFEANEDGEVLEAVPETAEPKAANDEHIAAVNNEEHLQNEGEDSSNLTYRLSVNRGKILKIIAIASLIIFIFSCIYSGFQMVGRLLRLR